MQEVNVFDIPLDEQVPELPKKKERTSLYNRKYVEETIRIRCRDFDNGVLVLQEAPQPNKPLVGKKGTFITSVFTHDLIVQYEASLNSKYPEIHIKYNYDDGSSFSGSQTIRIVEYGLHFGSDFLFVCPICNKNCKTLFLPRGDNFFACRDCKGLSYGKCYFKKNIKHHIPFYGLNRYNKVISNRPNHKRCTYNKRPTKKFLQLYKLYLKEGIKFSDDMAKQMKKYDIAWELRDFVFKNGLLK